MPNPVTCMTFSPYQRLLTAIEQSPIPGADKVRLTHFAVFVLLGQPGLLGYCIYSLVEGELLMALILFVTNVTLLLSWQLLCHLPVAQPVYRTVAVIFGVLLLSLIVNGGDGGSRSLWMLTYPLFVVFLVGEKEGFIWICSLLAATLLVLFVPLSFLHPFPYGKEFIVRFVSVYMVVAAIACWTEHFRAHSRTLNSAKRRQLESVLEALPAAVRLNDNTGRPLLCNRAYLVLTQLTHDEVFDPEEIDSPIIPPDMQYTNIPISAPDGALYRLQMWQERERAQVQPALSDGRREEGRHSMEYCNDTVLSSVGPHDVGVVSNTRDNQMPAKPL